MSELNKVYRKDYVKPAFTAKTVNLDVVVKDEYTLVTNTAEFEQVRGGEDLVLFGEGLELVSLEVDGDAVPTQNYRIEDENLIVTGLEGRFSLQTVVKIYPQNNNSGMGFYKSDSIFCTQCEPQGFRKITYFMDRPDVMAVYTVSLTAEIEKYPVLLSNGNLIAEEGLGNGLHKAVWHDPHPKPSYLFAMVVGDLAVTKDSYTTTSGREVDLRIYVDHGNESRSHHAMKSLKESMKWDEDTYGLECDLDIYMIVAVDSFNMGAMENKGLNIFNSIYTLADERSATDRDFLAVQGVVGHEYFHNWTGNRVTCQDWFQLTLKEGLTVFRDQEFSSDLNSRSVKRIESVSDLRAAQFPEDSGPMAHPVRPDSFVKIDNFYTSTVYGKGSEVIRMIETIIGKDNFKKGITKYFELYDGQAVTCDDFVYAMEQASGIDLTQFKIWYSQAGTPVVKVTSSFDAKAKTYTLKMVQEHPTQPENKPVVIPVKTGLLDKDGNSFVDKVLLLTESEQSFVFENVEEEPVPSLLRDFSAPVKLEFDYSNDDLVFLLANDDNEFNRYEASQRLSLSCIYEVIEKSNRGELFKIDKSVIEAYRKLLKDENLDVALKAKALTLPEISVIAENMDTFDPIMAFKAREFMLKSLAVALEFDLVSQYDALRNEKGLDKIGERALKNACLVYLSELGNMYTNVIYKQFEDADNMTDKLAAMKLLCDQARCCQAKSAHAESSEKDMALQSFYDEWKDDAVVMNKWFAVQAGTYGNGVLERVQELAKDPAFDDRNPNKLSALYRSYVANLYHFHNMSGAGYKFIADKVIEIDKFNNSVAAGLCRAFNKYVKLDPMRKGLMKIELERLASAELSEQVTEIVKATLSMKSE